MKLPLAVFVTILCGLAPTRAYSCSLIMPNPKGIFEESKLVVMARPMDISPKKADLELRETSDPYDQTVTWQVLYSWKGDLLPDGRLITSRKIHPDDPCTGWDVISDYQPRLIYATGEDPYNSYYSVPVSGAVYFLQFLQQQSVKAELLDGT